MHKNQAVQVFSFDYPPNHGGIARLCATFATALKQSGVSAHVLTQRAEKGIETPFIDRTISTQRVSRARPIREWYALKAMIGKRNQGCISGIWYPEGLIAALAGARPHIILAHGAELFPPLQTWRRPLWAWLRRIVLTSADIVIANSQYTAQLVRSFTPAANVAAVPLAVDHNIFVPNNRTQARTQWGIDERLRVLCSVSRVHRFKGHDMVLHALATLPSAMRADFTYLVAGQGPALVDLQALANQLGVADQVRWLGFVSEEQLPSLYQAADLFVLTTRETPTAQAVEGFGLVFLEAQACGTPVIGTRTGGIPDAVTHGDGGWLIEQDDIDALTENLCKLYADPTAFAAMGKRARQRVERYYTWNHYFARFRRALQDAEIEWELFHDY